MVLNFLKSSYNKLKSALAKTRSFLGQKLRSLFQGKIDEETLEKLEQVLYEADLGVRTAHEMTEKLQRIYRKNPNMTGEQLIDALRKEILSIVNDCSPPVTTTTVAKPEIILIIGVNGNGKTTSVAKLANRHKKEGKKVLIAAADTFRAAAIEQLQTWADRLQIDLVKGKPNSDPAAVVFDALTAAKARDIDTVIIDTAGRLHTKTHLMQELEKIKRTCQKFAPEGPHETLLVLDATIGQNAVDQAKIFHQFTPMTGLILTKLDGTAKGGIVISILRELEIPVKFVGLGELVGDFEPFDAESFTQALFD